MTNEEQARKVAEEFANKTCFHISRYLGDESPRFVEALTNALLQFHQEQDRDCPCAHATKPCNCNCPCGNSVMSGVCVMCVRMAASENKQQAADEILKQESEAVRELVAMLDRLNQRVLHRDACLYLECVCTKKEATALIAKHSRKEMGGAHSLSPLFKRLREAGLE